MFLSCFYLLNFSQQIYPLSLSQEEEASVFKVSGVLDRFLPTGEAVILLESLGVQLIARKEKLPPDLEPSMYLTIHLMEDDFEILAIDYLETRKQINKSKALQERLDR